jgi:hypothetical protein
MARRLGARKDGKFKAVSTAPSINKTPVGSSTPPLPYPVVQDLSGSVGTVPNVRFNGDPVYVLDQSTQPSCKGDAAGVLKGVRSGTVSGEVTPVKGSSSVRVGKKPVIRVGDPCTMNGGNCPGIYVTQPAPGATIDGGRPSASGNPPATPETPEEDSWWSKASPWVHGALGVASFVPGLSVVTGAADAAIYAAEGEMVEAGLAVASMVPGGKVVTTAGKAVKGAATAMKGAGAAQDAGKAVKAAKNAGAASKGAKAGKEADDAARLRKAEEGAPGSKKTDEEAAATGGGNGKDGAKVKGRKKLKCGEYGRYGPLKKKTGGGKFDRDHIPSKAALKKRAEELVGRELSPSEAKRIDAASEAIAIPREAHINVSPTHGQSAAQATQDAKNLAGSARHAIEAMLEKIDEYDPSGGCKKNYKRAAGRILRMSNDDYDKFLINVITNLK